MRLRKNPQMIRRQRRIGDERLCATRAHARHFLLSPKNRQARSIRSTIWPGAIGRNAATGYSSKTPLAKSALLPPCFSRAIRSGGPHPGLSNSSGLHLWGLGQRWHGFLCMWNLLADEAVKLPPVKSFLPQQFGCDLLELIPMRRSMRLRPAALLAALITTCG